MFVNVYEDIRLLYKSSIPGIALNNAWRISLNWSSEMSSVDLNAISLYDENVNWGIFVIIALTFPKNGNAHYEEDVDVVYPIHSLLTVYVFTDSVSLNPSGINIFIGFVYKS